MGERSYSFDANLQLADGATAVTGSGAATVAGSSASIDLGGNQGQTPTLQPRIDAMLVIYLAAVTVTTGCVYRLTLQGSNDSAFGSGSCQNLASMDFGIAASRDGNNAATTSVPTGTGSFGQVPGDNMFELPFTNEQNSARFEFLRLWVSVAGSSASIQFSAFVAVLPEP